MISHWIGPSSPEGRLGDKVTCHKGITLYPVSAKCAGEILLLEVRGK